jgi:hypothetical protein
LVDAGADVVEAADWVKLLSDLNVYNAPEWAGFLFKNDHLAKLLAGFKADPAATQMWANYLDLLGPDLLDGDEWEAAVYDQLRKAKASLGGAGVPLRSVLPAGGAAKLNAVDTLSAVLADPASAERLEGVELKTAFEAYGVAPLDGLRQVYLRGNFDKLELPRDAARLAAFAVAFRACFPVTHEYYSARTAVTNWLALSAACPDHARAEFQAHFVREYVPQDWHSQLLDESRQYPFHPVAEARIREGLAVAPKRDGERYARPAARSPAATGDAAFASEATRRAKKAKGRGSGGRRRDSGSGVWVWVVAVGLVAVALVVGIVLVMKNRGETKPTAPDTAPPPAKTDKDKRDEKKVKEKDKER